MSSKLERALILALVSISSLALAPATAEEQVVALLPSASDPVLERAFDVIRESNAAQQKQIKRDEYKPGLLDTKVVRSRRVPNHVYVLGGSAAMPM